MSSMEKRIAIIGAGIGGLIACKYALSKGFNPIVFEAQEQVGGLWTKTIESTRLQSMKDFFQFSDFPWPDSTDMFPTSAQLLEYLESYAKHFQLLPCIKFNSKVISIDYVGVSEEEMECWELWSGVGKPFGSKGKWNVKVLDTKQDSTKEYVFEFVILCIGRFSGLPDVPKFGSGYGPDVFSGNVLHSMDYAGMNNVAAAEFIKGKRIAVIGSGKSAVDIAFECAKVNGVNNPCTLIQRTTHWTIPINNVEKWGFYFSYLCFTRLFESMLHKPGEGFLSSVLVTLFSPLRWLASKYMENILKQDLPLKKYNMIPKASLVQEFASCQILFLPENFYDKVEEGSILLKKSQHFNFCKEGLILDGEADPMKVDIVIFATGYKGDEKLSNIFVSPTFQNYITGSPTSTIPLYRQMVLPRAPQLAILGYSESFSNLSMFEMKCQWLSHFLDGTFDLPSIKEMEKDVKMWDKYMKRYAGNGKFRRSCIGSVSIWYNDQLCKDIGCNPRRKNGFLTNLFQLHGIADYKGLAPES